MTPVTAVSELRDPVRLLIGDNEQPYRYADAVVDRAVCFTIKTGRVQGQELSPNATAIQPGITNPNDYLLLAYESALVLVRPNPDRESFRTRALSRSVGGVGAVIDRLQMEVCSLRSGTMFDGWGSLGNWLIGVGGLRGQELADHLTAATGSPTVGSVALDSMTGGAG